MALELAFVDLILICALDGGVMRLPKRREITLFVFTCLCITKSLLISYTLNIVSESFKAAKKTQGGTPIGKKQGCSSSHLGV